MADVTFYSQAGADAKFALKAGQLDRGAVESIISETTPRLHEHDASEINGILPADQVDLAGYAKMSDIPDTSTFVDTTELDNKNFVTRVWNTALKEAGVPLRRPYQARHTFATLMKGVHAPDKDKLELIGHTSTEMLRHYQDVNIEDLRRITDAL